MAPCVDTGCQFCGLPCKWSNKYKRFRKFCSSRCACYAGCKAKPTCKVCQTTLVRKSWMEGRALERMHIFLKRVYCGIKCSGIGRRSKSKSKQRASAMGARALAHVDKVCALCGARDVYLLIKRRDGDYCNIAVENLYRACLKCLRGERKTKYYPPPQICVYCGRPAPCREMCRGHYARWKRYGDPLRGIKLSTRVAQSVESLEAYAAHGHTHPGVHRPPRASKGGVRPPHVDPPETSAVIGPPLPIGKRTSRKEAAKIRGWEWDGAVEGHEYLIVPEIGGKRGKKTKLPRPAPRRRGLARLP